jgi:hypothetical protein
MPKEVLVALIGSMGSIIAAIVARRGESSRSRRSAVGGSAHARSQPARPALVFFVALSTGLSITALFFAYTVTSREQVEVKEGETLQNQSRRLYFLTLFCNSTIEIKDMSVKLGESEQSMALVASVSGGQRMSASAVVPPGWFYRIDVTKVSGLGCSFRRWRL